MSHVVAPSGSHKADKRNDHANKTRPMLDVRMASREMIVLLNDCSRSRK